MDRRQLPNGTTVLEADRGFLFFAFDCAWRWGLKGSLSNTGHARRPPSGVAPDRLVMIYSHSPNQDIGEVSYPDYEYFRKNNHVFTDIRRRRIRLGST